VSSASAAHVNALVVCTQVGAVGLYTFRSTSHMSDLLLTGPSALCLTDFSACGMVLVRRRRDTPKAARGTSRKCECGWRGSPWPQL
jgi:hypothetical protein